MTGHRTTLKGGKINYQVLRRINPEAARLAGGVDTMSWRSTLK